MDNAKSLLHSPFLHFFEQMGQKVLIAPLHWGLGHATRCIALIREQLAHGNEVLIAAGGDVRLLLEKYFPALEFVDLPFLTITYPRDGNMVRHFLWRSPAMVRSIMKEHRLLQRLVKERGIGLVISDSRFGLWTRLARCVFVTHQLQIQSPVLQGLINALNRWIMSRYDEVWVPDTSEFPGLAGKLSHPPRLPKNARYIGPLSRFDRPVTPQAPRWKAVAIISGPEPQRSMFETDIVRRFVESDEPALILRGKPGEGRMDIGKIKMAGHVDDEELLAELSRTGLVIARSGYSTVMDMHMLGLQAEWHPTPGQTEQEYLAELHRGRNTNH